jgi:protein KRI1
LEKSKNVNMPKEVDEEDSEKDSKFDEFEAKYNFRFEEEGGINMTTYKRDMEETYRQKDDKRIKKRKELEQRKKDEEEKIKNELKMARSIKKEEILGRVDQLEKIAGTNKIKLLVDELEAEYDPKNFDKLMNKIFDEKYYQELDNEENVKEVIEEKLFDYKTYVDMDKVDEIERRFEREDKEDGFEPEGYKNYITTVNQEKEGNQEMEDGDQEENQWWYCDGNLLVY